MAATSSESELQYPIETWEGVDAAATSSESELQHPIETWGGVEVRWPTQHPIETWGGVDVRWPTGGFGKQTDAAVSQSVVPPKVLHA